MMLDGILRKGFFSAVTLGMMAVPMVAEASHRFYVSDKGTKRVYRYDEAGSNAASWLTTTNNADPEDVFATNTHVYVLDSADKQIYRYAPNGGSPVSATVSRGLRNTAGSAIGTIRGMAIAGDDLYITDDIRIYHYSLSAAYATGGSTVRASVQRNFGTGNAKSHGLAIDSNYIYVVDQEDRQLYRYSRSAFTSAPVASRPMDRQGGGDLLKTEGAFIEGDQIWVLNNDSAKTLNRFALADLFPSPASVTDLNAAETLTVTGASDALGIALNPLPFVEAIERADADPTNAASVVFTVTFSELVTGVDAADFELTTTGDIADATIGTVAGTGSVRTVTVNTGTGSGTIRLDFVDDDSVVDVINAPVGGTGLGNGNFDSGEFYTIMRTAPEVSSIIPSETGPTNAVSIDFDVTFSGNVVNFNDEADLVITHDGTAHSNVSITGTGASYTATVSGLSGSGSFTVAVSTTSDVQDATGNAVTVSPTSDAVVIDTDAPEVVSLEQVGDALTNLGVVNFIITFSEAVSGVSASNFSLTGTLAAGAVIGTPVTTDGGLTWTIPVTGIAGTGSLGLDKTDNTGITDAAGNTLSGDDVTGDQFDVDQSAPVLSSITLAGTSPTNVSSVSFTVLFGEAVSGVTAANFSLTGSLAADASIGTPSSGDGVTWTVPVTGVSGTGSLGLDKTSNTGIVDEASNELEGGNVTGDLYDIDQTLPTSSASVTDSTRAGVSVLTIDFQAEDVDSGVVAVRLYARAPGAGSFTDTGLTETGTSGSFDYSVGTGGNGVYQFATVALDVAGNEQELPVAGTAEVLLNTVVNGAFVQMVVSGNDSLVFPMTDDLDVTIDLNGATPGQTIVVSRDGTLVDPPAYFRYAGKLLNESLTIVADDLGGSNHTITWEFDPASAAGIGADPIDEAYAFEGDPSPASVHNVSRVDDTLIISGVNTFSTWYAGNATAVPVTMSGFAIE